MEGLVLDKYDFLMLETVADLAVNLALSKT